MNSLSNDQIRNSIDKPLDNWLSRGEIMEALRELLAYREAQGVAVSLPDHMPYLNEETLNNIINQDQEGSVANAARILAREVKFWHSKPLYAVPQLPAVPDERVAFESFMEEKFRESIDRRECLNSDGAYMSWDMNVAWIVWQHRASMLSNASFREVDNSSTKHFRENSETSTKCQKCSGRGTYHCPQANGTVDCECTLAAAPKPGAK